MNELHLTKAQFVRTFRPIALLFCLFLSFTTHAVVAPQSETIPKFDLRKIKISQIEKLTGKKLTLFEKIKLKLLLKLVKKAERKAITGQQEKQAKASLLLGIGSLVLLVFVFTPAAILALLAIPAALAAIILGAQSVKGNSNGKGIAGIITGGITLGLIILYIALILILFAGFGVE